MQLLHISYRQVLEYRNIDTLRGMYGMVKQPKTYPSHPYFTWNMFILASRAKIFCYTTKLPPVQLVTALKLANPAMGCCSSKPAPGDVVRNTENFRDGYTAQAKVDAPAPVTKGSELSSTYRNSEVGSVNSASQKQQPQQTRDPSSSLGEAHESQKKQEQALSTPSVPGKQMEENDVLEGNRSFCAGPVSSVDGEDARMKSLAPSGPDKPILPAVRLFESNPSVLNYQT